MNLFILLLAIAGFIVGAAVLLAALGLQLLALTDSFIYTKDNRKEPKPEENVWENLSHYR